MNTLLVILVVLVVAYVCVTVWARGRRGRWGVAEVKVFRENWQRILAMEDEKHAVMEADKLLDKMLGRRGFHGSLGEKLKRARKIFRDNDAVWEAHKLRNRIAHELDFSVRKGAGRRAMDGYRKAFMDLGLLK